MSLLEVHSLSHRFADGSFGLQDVSFNVESGELIVLAGSNGAGKTVLMKHLNGLLSPTSGEVLLNGRPIGRDLLAARQAIGLVFQDPDNQFVGQTVRDDVAFGPENLRLSEGEIEARTTTAIDAVGLGGFAEQQPHLLSGGEKRRLAIAGVLAMQPALLILDEPFSGLDYPGTRQALTELIKLHEAGHTLIVITHEVDKILGHATRLIVMDRGRIVEDGDPADLIDSLEQYGVRPPAIDGRGLRGVTWLHS